jgi:CAAX prenyl protease-like protein
MAPVVEELAFRGYLARRLMRVHFESVGLERLSPFAILVSSAVFAALHRQPLAGLVAGLAFAWAARRRGRLADAVVAHATTNALLVAYALPTGAWWVIG